MAIGEGAHMVLYRGDAVGDGEETITADSASAAQKVEFDQVGIGMFDWGHSLERFRPSVPDPNAESPRKPDTGLSALKVMIHATAHRHDVGAQPGTQDGPARQAQAVGRAAAGRAGHVRRGQVWPLVSGRTWSSPRRRSATRASSSTA